MHVGGGGSGGSGAAVTIIPLLVELLATEARNISAGSPSPEASHVPFLQNMSLHRSLRAWGKQTAVACGEVHASASDARCLALTSPARVGATTMAGGGRLHSS